MKMIKLETQKLFFNAWIFLYKKYKELLYKYVNRNLFVLKSGKNNYNKIKELQFDKGHHCTYCWTNKQLSPFYLP